MWIAAMCIALPCTSPMSIPDHPRARFFFGSVTPRRSSRAIRASRSRRMISDSGVDSCAASARYRACCLGVMSTTKRRLATSSFLGPRGIFQTLHREALHMQPWRAWLPCRTSPHRFCPMLQKGIARTVSFWLTGSVSSRGERGGDEKTIGVGESKRVHSTAIGGAARWWRWWWSDKPKPGFVSMGFASAREFRNGTTGCDGR
jgi:hypothetical protein